MSVHELAVIRRPAPPKPLARRIAESAAVRDGVEEIRAWMARSQMRNPLTVRRVPFDRLDGWRFEPRTGDLGHESGRFFAVRGVHVRTDYGAVGEWSQPIIHQPEGGILGIVVKEIDGVLHLLAQVKIEPGNINPVQLSPTVQATPSNYLRAHRGNEVPFLAHFVDPPGSSVLVDVLQSEQGSWFFGKRNRNMVVEVATDVDHGDDFRWLTFGQVHELMRHPNVVNMDMRSVLSCLPSAAHLAGLAAGPGDRFRAALSRSMHAGRERSARAASWLTGRKAAYELTTVLASLDSVVGWRRSGDEIRHAGGRFFRILGVEVDATNREVRHWCQPLLEPCGDGLVAFVVRRRFGTLEVLSRADVRPGYRDVAEIGPTVQCTPQNVASPDSPGRPPLLDLVLGDEVTVHFDVDQSEEGGRFHHAVSRHMIVEVDADAPIEPAPDHAWMTVADLVEQVRTSYRVNIEARSLLACLHSLA